MNELIKKFELGQWIEFAEGLGQVIYIRENYVEKFDQDYFEGLKPGTKLGYILICKVLCDFSGNIRSRNRIFAAKSDDCNPISENYLSIVEKIKQHQSDEYQKYLLYDDKKDIGGTVTLHYRIENERLADLSKQLSQLSLSLPRSFTLKEFNETAKEHGLLLNIDEAKKFVPGAELNLYIHLFCRMYKVLNKQRIYSHMWFQVR